MAKNLDKNPMADKENREKRLAASPPKHGITKFKKLDWTDEEQLTNFVMENVSGEELDRLKTYIRTLIDDETLSLTNFEVKRIAIAMLALDRGDNWFFKKMNDSQYDELSIELQKFLAGKESMIIETLRKAKTAEKKAKNLWDQLDGEFKSWEIKGEGQVEGVDYIFEAKKKNKPKMLKVVIDDNEQLEEESSGSESSEDSEEDKEG